MSTPFIGMNPQLEDPDLWTEVHHQLISAIAIHLGPALRPKYRIAMVSDRSETIVVSLKPGDPEPILDL
jgi:hypothetical protein